MPDALFTVSGQSESWTRLAVQVRDFELIVDEPIIADHQYERVGYHFRANWYYH